jgi:hypothetical protein
VRRDGSGERGSGGEGAGSTSPAAPFGVGAAHEVAHEGQVEHPL